MYRPPLTYGVFCPVILLPKSTDWTDEAGLKAILTHELTHVRRFDTLTKLVLSAAVCVHWFNPLVWVMYVLANRDIELSCDEAVVRSLGEDAKSAYAMTLIRLAERKSRLAPLVSGFAKNAVEERITAIMKIKKRSIAGVVLALVLVVVTVTAFATSAAGAENENDTLSASEAIEQLVGSVLYTDGELSFQIPENYPDAKNWNILISGRTEQDGLGLSVHYLTEENESKSWEAGKRYVIPLTGSSENYTELLLTASLPDETGATDERDVDLLAVISFPSPGAAASPAADDTGNSENSATNNAESGTWVWPVEGCDTVTSRFGKRVHPVSGMTTDNDHITISGDNADGAKVYAALSGTVSETGFDTDRGNYIRITHAGGVETVYAHLKEALVADGDTVAAGETIGAVGQTGKATGPCLAFYVYVDGEATDPLEYYTVVSANTADTAPAASPQDDSTERNGIATAELSPASEDTGNRADNSSGYVYPVNKNGETYGSSAYGNPDLTAAIGTEGQSGYIREKEIPGANVSTLEEAAEYMEWIKTQPSEIMIPLYDQEGNIIGEFAVSNTPSLEYESLEEAREAVANDNE